MTANSYGVFGPGSAGTSSGTSAGTSSGTSGDRSSESMLQDARILSRAGIVGPFKEGYHHLGPTNFSLFLNSAARTESDRLHWWDHDQVISIALGEALERLQVVGGFEQGLVRVQVHDGLTTFVDLVRLVPPEVKTLAMQLPLVIAYADLRSERSAEIAAQQGWPLGLWTGLLGMQPRRHVHTILLMRVAQDLVVHLNRRIKHLCDVPRPSQLSPQVQPMIDVPQHSSWPGGHAAEGFVAATVLHALITEAQSNLHPDSAALLKQQLNRLAARIAQNRVVAGLHYPLDTLVGRVIGQTLAEYLKGRCKTASTYVGRAISADPLGNGDFHLGLGLNDAARGMVELPLAFNPNPAPALAHLWNEAIKEWA